MTRMTETLESREMFSVVAAEPTTLPVDAAAPTDVVVEKKATPKLLAACCRGTVFTSVSIHS